MICAATCGVPSASEGTLMMRPSRSRTGRYANTSSRTRWPRGCDGRDADVRCAVYAISADTLLPVIECSLLHGPEGDEVESGSTSGDVEEWPGRPRRDNPGLA